MSIDWTKDVLQFHKHINYENGKTPKSLKIDDFQQRVDYMEEEVSELIFCHDDKDLYGEVDALLDLIYFAIGTLLKMGVDPRPCWDEVHRANMDKLPAVNHKNSVKPEGWRAPQHHEVIRGLDE